MTGELDVEVLNARARSVVSQRLRGLPKEDLEDTVGNTWVSLLGTLEDGRFRRECSIPTLVYQIAYRRSLDRLRRLMKERKHMTELSTDPRYRGPSPEKLAEDRQRLKVVLDEFAAMPEDTRTVANMYFFDDYSVPEIAVVLDMGDRLVRRKIGFALARLRACFDEQVKVLAQRREYERRQRLIGWVNRFYRCYVILDTDENGLLVPGVPTDARQAREDIINTLKGDY